MTARARRPALACLALTVALAVAGTAQAERVANRPNAPGNQGQGQGQNPGQGQSPGQTQNPSQGQTPPPAQGQGGQPPAAPGQGQGAPAQGGSPQSPGQGDDERQGQGQNQRPAQGQGQQQEQAQGQGQPTGSGQGASLAQRPSQRPPIANGRPAGAAVAGADAPSSGGGTRRSIVVFRDSVKGVAELAVRQAAKEAAGGQPDRIFSRAIKGWSGSLTAAARRRLADDPRVLFVSADRVVEATTTVRATDPVPTGVARIGGPGTVSAYPGVAVIDTGIAKHSELNVQGGWNCLSGPVRSWGDANGHGTHVAGTIAARANDAGVIGVAPGAPLYAVRVLDRTGSGTWSSVICGLEWAVRNANSVKVVNLSLSGGGTDGGDCGSANGDALHRAVCSAVAAGITVVVAAGNTGTDIAGSVPAAYDEAITVSALADYDGAAGGTGSPTCGGYGGDDTFAGFSNFARTEADRAHMLAAPGACIRSTWLKGGYQTLSGTSMASPHVAGAAAVLLAATPGLSLAAVRDALRGSGEALGAGHLDPRGLNPEPLLRRP